MKSRDEWDRGKSSGKSVVFAIREAVIVVRESLVLVGELLLVIGGSLSQQTGDVVGIGSVVIGPSRVILIINIVNLRHIQQYN